MHRLVRVTPVDVVGQPHNHGLCHVVIVAEGSDQGQRAASAGSIHGPGGNAVHAHAWLGPATDRTLPPAAEGGGTPLGWGSS